MLKVPGKLCVLQRHLGRLCTGYADQVLCGYVAQLDQLQHGYLPLLVWSHQHISLMAGQKHQMQAWQISHTDYFNGNSY